MWIVYSLISLVGFVFMHLFMTKIANSNVPSEYFNAVLSLMTGCMFLVIVLAKRTTSWDFLKAPLLWDFIIASLCLVVAGYFQYKAFATAPNPGFVKAIHSLQIVFIGLIAISWFGSSFNWQQGIGVVLVVSGISLVVLN